jgi:S1-C subfamily serine protease
MSYEMSGRAVPVGLAVAVEPGAMLTTCHGIAGNSQMVVRYGAESLSANLSATDEVLDLCKLAVTGMNARAIEIAADEAKAGDKIFVLGANAAGDFALTEGTVKGVRMASGVKVLELSVPIAASASGGAVFDVYGRLVGVATTPHRYGANVNAAISSAWISQMRTRGRPQQ